MDVMHHTESEQAARWNSVSGHAWVDAQAVLDQMYKPFEELLSDVIPAGSASSVLDVGCGTGGTTVAAARRLGAGGSCVGVDISEPMIAAARARAETERLPVRFIHADAQGHAFEPASFDIIMSRFGVMFFSDPTGAFANLRRAATRDAHLRFIAWRRPEDNPFMTTAERAAAPLLPMLPARRPDGPGQFGFADRDRVTTILAESGWREIDLEPIDTVCTLPEKELVRYLTRFGPVGQILHEVAEPTRTQVVETVRAAFEPYVQGPEVRFTAACWLAVARAR